MAENGIAIVVELDRLRGALKLICPAADWSWLSSLTKRIAASAPHKPKKHNLVTSEQLYAFGNQLMDGAATNRETSRCVCKTQALQYRDGLIIALSALIPLRRRTLVALRIGKHLVSNDDRWELVIPAADTKTRQPLDYPISKELCTRIDLYLSCFRRHLPGADTHTGLWASNKQRPISAVAMCAAVRRRTNKAFGFTVNLHRFRHAAATFWSIHDPENVGHASMPTRQAGRVAKNSNSFARLMRLRITTTPATSTP